MFLWPIVTMGYFGLGLSMTQLGGNIFVSFILGALTEVGDDSAERVTVLIELETANRGDNKAKAISAELLELI